MLNADKDITIAAAKLIDRIGLSTIKLTADASQKNRGK